MSANSWLPQRPTSGGKENSGTFYKEIPYIFVKRKKKEFMGHYGELGWLEDLLKTVEG